MDSPKAPQNIRTGRVVSILPVAAKSSAPDRWPSWKTGAGRSDRGGDPHHAGECGEPPVVVGQRGRVGALGEHGDRAARAAGELLPDVLLHHVGLGRRRQLPVVRRAELHLEERQAEQQQRRHRPDGEQWRPAHDQPSQPHIAGAGRACDHDHDASVGGEVVLVFLRRR
jgi:hypothetical protein